MKKIVALSYLCADNVLIEEIKKIRNIIDQSWQVKKLFGNFISNYNIDIIQKKLISFRLTRAKLLCVRGSGFMRAFVPIRRKENYLSYCRNSLINIEKISIDTDDSRVIN